ncbi:MAG: hypothetical protein KIG60_08285 [Caryophanon sp.]|nr:hypothetical protein [Caryophanon sp.]
MLNARINEQLFLQKLRAATYYNPIVLLNAYVTDETESSGRIDLDLAKGAEDIVAQDLPVIRMCLQQVMKHLNGTPAFLLCRAVCYVNDDDDVKISLFVDMPYELRQKFAPIVLEIKRMMEAHMTEEMKRRYLHLPPSVGA